MSGEGFDMPGTLTQVGELKSQRQTTLEIAPGRHGTTHLAG